MKYIKYSFSWSDVVPIPDDADPHDLNVIDKAMGWDNLIDCAKEASFQVSEPTEEEVEQAKKNWAPISEDWP